MLRISGPCTTRPGEKSVQEKKFNQSVLANVFSENVWIIGFVTDEEMHKFDMGAEMVAIYVPQAYNWAGQLYVLPRHKIRKIERISPGDSMKYAVTGDANVLSTATKAP